MRVGEARYKTYRVAYEWVLDNRIDPGILQDLLDQARQGLPLYFHDQGDNGDINNADEPLGHASILVQYLNRRLADTPDREEETKRQHP